MNYGYCRCSTSEKDQDINRQKRELSRLGVKESNIYYEYDSGSNEGRIQFNRLLSVVREGDSITATEVSRFTRSVKQLCELIELAKEKRLKLIIGSFVVDLTRDIDPMTDGMLKMMGVFAEMERSIISRRIKSGMENARDKGKKIGRPRSSPENLPSSFIRHYPKYRDRQINLTELSKLCGVTRQTVYNYLKVYGGGVRERPKTLLKSD